MLDVMFYEVFDEERKVLPKFLPPQLRVRFSPHTIQETKSPNPPAKVISIRTQSRIPSPWAGKIAGILTRSQGYDHLTAFCRQAQSSVPCGYIGNYCARAVAEHAILTAMALLRKLKKQMGCFERFERDGLTGLECQRRRALVVGVGNIGSEIVEIARALRMDVKGSDIEKRRKDLEYVTLKEGVRWAEVVFCACSLTDQTQGMLDYGLFRHAKPGLIFVNVGRGEISPAEDLKALLSKGVLGGLSLDVYDEESALADHLRGLRRKTTTKIRSLLELSDRDNVLLTPHNAFNTAEALEDKCRLSAESIVGFLRRGEFPRPVPSAIPFPKEERHCIFEGNG